MGNLSERLSEALTRAGKTRMELARFCGVTHPSVSNWFNGRTKELAGTNAVRAAQFLGVSVRWLTTGVGEMVPAPEVGTQLGSADASDLVGFGLCEAVFSGQEVSFAPIDEESGKRVTYSERWIEKQGARCDNCRRFRVTGDAMRPLLFDGDTVLVDCAQSQKPKAGKVYLVAFGGSTAFRRVFPSVRGGVTLVAENAATPVEEIAPTEMDQFRLIGRVLDREGASPF